MSYSIMSSCYNCSREECTDEQNIIDAINKIHENCLGEGGHLGAGTIVICCVRCKNPE